MCPKSWKIGILRIQLKGKKTQNGTVREWKETIGRVEAQLRKRTFVVRRHILACTYTRQMIGNVRFVRYLPHYIICIRSSRRPSRWRSDRRAHGMQSSPSRFLFFHIPPCVGAHCTRNNSPFYCMASTFTTIALWLTPTRLDMDKLGYGLPSSHSVYFDGCKYVSISLHRRATGFYAIVQ